MKLNTIARVGLLTAVLLSLPAAADDRAELERLRGALNARDLDGAIAGYRLLAERAAEPEVKAEAQLGLGEALAQRKLPAAAALIDAQVVQAGKDGPAYARALEAVVGLQRRLDDPFLLPTLVAQQEPAAWQALSPEAAARSAYLVAVTHQRALELGPARTLLESVPEASAVGAKARYLLGVLLADPRLPGGARPDDAIQAFQAVLALHGDQEDLARTQQLALLGLGRTHYAQGRYPEAVKAYERVPRFSRYWDQALFENAFARFRNGDPGGALGSLQALHAPQFEGAFQPESWMLKASVYHFSCLFDESKAALQSFEKRYLPMMEQVKPLAEAAGDDYASYFALVADPAGTQLPRPILLWVRNNERIRGVLMLIAELDREKKVLADAPGLKGEAATALGATLDQNRAVLVQAVGKLVKNRLAEAWENIHGFNNDGDLIRLETTLAEKRLLEQGVDREKLLADQKLHRPPMPSEAWSYWQFQGEFWIDEIGYYQYTLRQGCPAPEAKR